MTKDIYVNVNRSGRYVLQINFVCATLAFYGIITSIIVQICIWAVGDVAN